MRTKTNKQTNKQTRYSLAFAGLQINTGTDTIFHQSECNGPSLSQCETTILTGC